MVEEIKYPEEVRLGGAIVIANRAWLDRVEFLRWLIRLEVEKRGLLGGVVNGHFC